MKGALTRLAATIAARKAAGDAGQSYTASLLAEGPARCAQKFGEEAVETVIAGAAGDRRALIEESADALYHLLVLLSVRDVALDEVLDELARREGVSGIEEKEARGREGG